MKTLQLIKTGALKVPMTTSWYLSDIGRAQGIHDLYSRQSPQKLKLLCEHAIAQSVVSSNRIEGVQIDQSRIGTVVFGRPALNNRDEEEVAGYRDALAKIHTDAAQLPMTTETILMLHKLSRGAIWDAGQYKHKPVDIVEKLPTGGERLRFRSVSPEKTPECMDQLVSFWFDLYRDRIISPLILLAAFNLDFLCIHPFRDGNGRVSRLLLLLAAYHVGIEVGRYVSLERLIEDNEERYYETLEQSSLGWHEGRHDPWPYIGYLMYIIKLAYDEFEMRVGKIKAPKGEKTALIEAAIHRQSGSFTVSDLRDACPGVGVDLIRKVLGRLKGKTIECLGRGQSAKWVRMN